MLGFTACGGVFVLAAASMHRLRAHEDLSSYGAVPTFRCRLNTRSHLGLATRSTAYLVRRFEPHAPKGSTQRKVRHN